MHFHDGLFLESNPIKMKFFDPTNDKIYYLTLDELLKNPDKKYIHKCLKKECPKCPLERTYKDLIDTYFKVYPHLKPNKTNQTGGSMVKQYYWIIIIIIIIVILYWKKDYALNLLK